MFKLQSSSFNSTFASALCVFKIVAICICEEQIQILGLIDFLHGSCRMMELGGYRDFNKFSFVP